MAALTFVSSNLSASVSQSDLVGPGLSAFNWPGNQTLDGAQRPAFQGDGASWDGPAFLAFEHAPTPAASPLDAEDEESGTPASPAHLNSGDSLLFVPPLPATATCVGTALGLGTLVLRRRKKRPT